jgi:phosphatidylinositol alpha-1,6-mannosyltransferase
MAAWNMARALRETLRSGFRPEAVIATKWSPEGQAYQLTGARRHAPLVLMGHGREFLPEPGRPIRAWAQRAVIRAAAGGIANSRFTAGQLVAAGLPESRVRVVHPGIDPAEFPTLADPEAARARLAWPAGPTLLTICRLVRRKGIDTVIQALPRLAETVPDVRHMVLGRGPDLERLRALAGSLGVTDRVRFLGALSDEDKAAAVHLCDVLVMPSRDIPSEPPEGFGIVYLEANLCGKPVIGADTGGVSDAVEDGVNGLLVQPDRPNEVAEAAARLLRSPEFARRLGEQGKRRAVERFAWSVIAPQFAEAVRRILCSEA